tara:strand:- start:98 stop:577 length:480 start_codon:yes stop_codon:yes gene_type:complete
MDRYNFEEHISAYIDKELSQEDRIKFEGLMDSHPNLKEKYNEVNKLVMSLKSIPKLETDNDFFDKLNKRIDNNRESGFSIFNIFEKYIFPKNTKPIIGFAMSFAAISMIFYSYLDNNNIASSSTDMDEQNYFSDIDSTDIDEEQYENEIQLTKGLDLDE